MGTNYWWHEPANVCEHCGRGDSKKLHIGKSSAGWCFNLRIYPERDIRELGDWLERWRQPGSKILDECGKEVTVHEMMTVILARWWGGDDWTPERLAENHAVLGPFGLARAAHCQPGKWGPYALNLREFI